MPKTVVQRPKQGKNKKSMLVRYGRMMDLGLFEHNETRIPMMPTRVVIKTERGLELGELVGQLAPYKGGQFRFNEEQISRYFRNSQVDFGSKPIGRFVRYATAADISEERHLQKIVEEEIEFCKCMVKERDLPMKIVDAEHVFGGERIVFYFMAEGRVDFRALVKDLAREYQSRIEMRQIGSRDEGKLLADVETCGQECCCRRFLKVLKPVNMRMAKLQKATLDPAKISGFCGRLRCCLRYEDRTYTDLKRRMPARNTRVKTAHGQGRVIETQLLTQLVVVEHNDGVRNAFALDDIEIITPPPAEERTKRRRQAPAEAREPQEVSDEKIPNQAEDDKIECEAAESENLGENINHREQNDDKNEES